MGEGCLSDTVRYESEQDRWRVNTQGLIMNFHSSSMWRIALAIPFVASPRHVQKAAYPVIVFGASRTVTAIVPQGRVSEHYYLTILLPA